MAHVVVELGRGLILPFPMRRRRLSLRRIDWKSEAVRDAVRLMPESARAEPHVLRHIVRQYGVKPVLASGRPPTGMLQSDPLARGAEAVL